MLGFENWSVMAGHQKPTRKELHCGSTYYYECENERWEAYFAGYYNGKADNISKEFASATSSAPAKPVAWLVRSNGGTNEAAYIDRADIDDVAMRMTDRHVIPLYAAPPAPANDKGPITDGWQLSYSATGHSGPGVYAHCDEYPEEGSVFLLSIPAPQAPIPPNSAELKPQSPAVRDVLAERQRQVKKGYTAEHDDDHTDASIALAGACHAAMAAATAVISDINCTDISRLQRMGVSLRFCHALWPWGDRGQERVEPRDDLVKAGALIIAEIDRLDRAAAKGAA